MADFIPYGRQDISQDDINAVMEVLQSDFLTQGPKIQAFEEAVAEYCGAKFAVAVSNATMALHLAYLAAGLKKNEFVWTSTNTFVATANGALYCQGKVRLLDINPKTYNLDVLQLEDDLIKSEELKGLPKIVVPVHIAGQSCDMEAIHKLSGRYGFSVVEDASHCIGGSYKTNKIGSCRYSDMTVFSFHPVKIITTGEGGMILTNRKDLYEKLLLLRTHGITRDPKQMTEEPHGVWYYQQIDLGYNYRITDIQAALGLSQLKHLDEFVEKRKSLAARYNRELKGLPITIPWQNPETASSWHLYIIQLRTESLRKSQKAIFQEMRELGIGVNLHYIPVHLHPYYQRELGFKKGDLPKSEEYYAKAMSLPIYPSLTESQQDRVISSLKSVLK